MRQTPGPICELTFLVAPELAADFDAWLAERVRDHLPAGSVDCRLFPGVDHGEEKLARVCQLLFETDAALDYCLDAGGPGIGAAAIAAFGGSVETSTRILREDRPAESPQEIPANCLNCGARLSGQYCGQCGQRSRSRLISLWELVSDAFGDLFELDSRLWRTLVPLVLRPGRLTHDYLLGRRARYMPPFRMYLVMSLIFFVVAFFDPSAQLGLLFEEPQALPTPDATASPDSVPDGVAPEPPADEPAALRLTMDNSGEGGLECSVDPSDVSDLPDWLARRLTAERLQHICERAQLDNGRALFNEVIDNVPTALIVLLPLMALVLKALYPLSRRYYVEHLLFVVHFHAFFFLVLALQILFSRLATVAGLPEVVSVLALVATSLYIPVYLFVAMRRVYAQGRFFTVLKYLALVTSYVFGFSATMLGALAIAAFSI